MWLDPEIIKSVKLQLDANTKRYKLGRLARGLIAPNWNTKLTDRIWFLYGHYGSGDLHQNGFQVWVTLRSFSRTLIQMIPKKGFYLNKVRVQITVAQKDAVCITSFYFTLKLLHQWKEHVNCLSCVIIKKNIYIHRICNNKGFISYRHIIMNDTLICTLLVKVIISDMHHSILLFLLYIFMSKVF